jgi:D-alanyl-D-alanine carboxypeptidase
VYSNLGYIVAGAAIERITGTSFKDALRKYIYQPLGITSGGFGPPPHIWGHKPRLRIGPLAIGKGAPADPADTYSDNPAVMNSAGRLHFTLADWGRFNRAFLPSGSHLLQARSIEHLLKVPYGRGAPIAMGWARATALADVSYGMQGSNSMWSATAPMNDARTNTALVVCNDGRSCVLQVTFALAAAILDITRNVG